MNLTRLQAWQHVFSRNLEDAAKAALEAELKKTLAYQFAALADALADLGRAIWATFPSWVRKRFE